MNNSCAALNENCYHQSKRPLETHNVNGNTERETTKQNMFAIFFQSPAQAHSTSLRAQLSSQSPKGIPLVSIGRRASRKRNHDSWKLKAHNAARLFKALIFRNAPSGTFNFGFVQTKKLFLLSVISLAGPQSIFNSFALATHPPPASTVPLSPLQHVRAFH